MYQVSRWSFRMAENVPGFCPNNGIWHWDHWSTSTGMRALGVAAISAIFPDKSNEKEIAAIEHCGDIIAQRIFAMVKETEAFSVKGKEMIQCIAMERGGLEALAELFS